MKKVLVILSAIVLLSSCAKEQVLQTEVDQSKNPVLISVSVNDNTSEIVRVK